MDVFKTPGAFSWSELVTPDPKAASEFYGSLFGWTVETMNMGMEYRVVKVGDAAIGGLMAPPPGAPAMPPSWSVYVTVADVDATVVRCTAMGGKVCVPVMEVPNVGRMAVLADPQGAMFNVMQYNAA